MRAGRGRASRWKRIGVVMLYGMLPTTSRRSGRLGDLGERHAQHVAMHHLDVVTTLEVLGPVSREGIVELDEHEAPRNAIQVQRQSPPAGADLEHLVVGSGAERRDDAALEVPVDQEVLPEGLASPNRRAGAHSAPARTRAVRSSAGMSLGASAASANRASTMALRRPRPSLDDRLDHPGFTLRAGGGHQCVGQAVGEQEDHVLTGIPRPHHLGVVARSDADRRIRRGEPLGSTLDADDESVGVPRIAPRERSGAGVEHGVEEREVHLGGLELLAAARRPGRSKDLRAGES